MCEVVREPSVHDKLKHIEIKYHYIRDMVQRGAVKLLYVATEEQIADIEIGRASCRERVSSVV